MEEEEPSQSENMLSRKRPKRNLGKAKVDNSEKTTITKRSKRRHQSSCPLCTFVTNESYNMLEIHMRSHEFKCPCCDFTCYFKRVLDEHCSEFHDKPTSSSKASNDNGVTNKEEEMLVGVESTSSDKELTNNSAWAIEKKNLGGVKSFPTHPKTNTRSSATVQKNPILHQIFEKSLEDQMNPTRAANFSFNEKVEESMDSADNLGRPKLAGKKKTADIGVQTETLPLDKIHQLSLEEIDKEEKMIRELIKKLEADYENGKRSLTAAQLQNASASELKTKLEQCLEIVSDGHDKISSGSLFETIRCSAQNYIRRAIEQVEAVSLTDLSNFKRSQEVIVKELHSAKIRMSKVEGMKSVKIAEIDLKKRMELLNKLC